MNHHDKTNQGFTILELLVVISIISLLSSIILANFRSVRVNALDARTQEHKHQVVVAMEMYRDTYGGCPYTANLSLNCVGPSKCYQNGVEINSNSALVLNSENPASSGSSQLAAAFVPGPQSNYFPKIFPDNTQNGGIIYQCTSLSATMIRGNSVCAAGSSWVSYYTNKTNTWTTEAVCD